MNVLDTTLSLLSRTEGRDVTLRLLQYATLPFSASKGAAQNVYEQVRRTRKVLRFLRTLEYSKIIREEIYKFDLKDVLSMISKILFILENIATLFFFLSDHRVLLSDLGVLSQAQKQTHYPRSMKFYLIANIVGCLKDISQLVIILTQNKYEGKSLNFNEAGMIFRCKCIDLIKCFFDCFVASHYLQNKPPSFFTGILGFLSSIIAIWQKVNSKNNLK